MGAANRARMCGGVACLALISASASVSAAVPAAAAPGPDSVAPGRGTVDAGTRAARASAAPDRESEIVVTGSRIAQTGAQSPTPLTTFSVQDLGRTAPSNIIDGLNTMPQFQGSNSQYQTFIANPTNANAGNNLNLRNLGAVRVLVLLDGVRLPPSGGNGLVDVNIVPQILIKRIDVVTGGASAAYGSDAVSGVVNFMIDNAFTGVKATAQGGISQRGDTQSVRLGMAAGAAFKDNSIHIVASGEYYKNNGIEDLFQRENGPLVYSVVGKNGGIGGTAANPYVAVANSRSAVTSFNGVFRNGPLANRQIMADGSIVPFQTGNLVGAGVCTNCSGSYNTGVSFVPKQETIQLYSHVDADLSDSIKFGLTGLYSTSKNWGYGGAPFFRPGASTELTIFPENAFLPAAAAAALAGGASVGFTRQFRELPSMEFKSKVDTFSVGGKLEGDFSAAWKWDAGYIHAESTNNFYVTQWDNQKMTAALDAVRDPLTDQIVCRASLTHPGLYPGCVPFNPFGEGGAPQTAALAYMDGASRVRAKNKMDVVNANIRGSLFALPAGDVKIAIGGEYRKQSLRQVSNSDPSVPVSSTGLRGFKGGQYVISNFASANGSVEVKEGYGEILVPLLADKPFARQLDINGAIRYTDYSTSGGETTWKVGGSWAPADGLRFRATRSRDIRAPTLFELFAGRQRATTFLVDPHTGASRSPFVVSGGNDRLKPEQADTYTVGIVFNPEFEKRLTISVDYYHIKIKDAIANPFTPQQLVQLCENSNGQSELCNLVVRPFPFSNRTADNAPVEIQTIALNVSNITTAGIDTEINYVIPKRDFDISLRAVANYLDKYDQLQAPGQNVFHFAGNGDINDRLGGLPKFRAQASVALSSDSFMAALTGRYVGHSKRSKLIVFEDNDIPARLYLDLALSRTLAIADHHMTMFFNINNLLDSDPPLIVATSNPGVAYPTYRGLYDVVGRAFTVGLKVTM